MMFKRLRASMKSDFMKRQLYMMTNLGLFYIILIAMFAIPLLGSMVIILIKGVFDYRHFILGFGLLVVSVVIYLLCRFFFRFFFKLKQDGNDSLREMHRILPTGERVQIDFFKGVFSLSMGGDGQKTLSQSSPPTRLSLPEHSGEDLLDGSPDPIRQIKELHGLYKNGIINQDEFDTLKKTIIQKASTGHGSPVDTAREAECASEDRLSASWPSSVDPPSKRPH